MGDSPGLGMVNLKTNRVRPVHVDKTVFYKTISQSREFCDLSGNPLVNHVGNLPLVDNPAAPKDKRADKNSDGWPDITASFAELAGVFLWSVRRTGMALERY